MNETKPPYGGALPKPTPETQAFWDGTLAHKLMLPWCTECGKPHFYPRSICPFCLSRELEWREASGRGKLHTYVINSKAAKGFTTVPYVIAVVELNEGPRMMTNIVIDDPTPEKLPIDAAVEVIFDDVTEAVTLAKFRLVQP